MRTSKVSRKVKKVPQSPIPVQLLIPKRPASSPKEARQPSATDYSPGNSTSFSLLGHPPPKKKILPHKHKVPHKSAPKPSATPVPFEFSRRTSQKTVKLSSIPKIHFFLDPSISPSHLSLWISLLLNVPPHLHHTNNPDLATRAPLLPTPHKQAIKFLLPEPMPANPSPTTPPNPPPTHQQLSNCIYLINIQH